MRTDVVGRERELHVLAAALADARAGRARLVLVHGEPGIGKTRLTEELLARAGDVAVGWGTATDAAGAPPYWPWRQVLRGLARTADLVALAEEQGTVPDLARLAPELYGARPDEAHGGGTAEDRFRLFDAVARLLGALAATETAVVVLDDAQWVDTDSLLLLRHVAHGVDREHLLLLVTHRDTAPVPPVLAAELLREPVTRSVALHGLRAPDVARQLGDLLGRPVPDAEAARVHDRTGGNPFFVGEVGRTLLDDRHPPGAPVPVPASVREAIGARLDRLAPPTGRLLRAAAVLGREFRVSLLAAVADRPVLECLAAVDEAAGAGLVEALGTPEEHRFVHDLVRDAVEACLATPERVRLHRAAAEAVESLGATHVDAHLSDLARHWAVAAVAGERSRAAGWIRRAAEDAVHRTAYDEAAELYRLALEVAGAEIDDEARCRLLLARADALRRAERTSGRLEACRDAAALARRLARSDLLGEAALALRSGDAEFDHERLVRQLCEEALDGPGTMPAPLRARVAANLSDACMYLRDTESAGPASAEALSVAQECGDPEARAAALRARQLVCSGPDGLAARARIADEMLALGRTTRSPGTRMWAHLWRIDVGLQRGDLAAVARELDALAGCVEHVRGPVARWHLLQAGAVLAQARARFSDARRLAAEALGVLQPTITGHGSAVINHDALLAVMRLHTGGEPDGPGPPVPPDRAGLDAGHGVIFALAAARQLVEDGRLAQARSLRRDLGPPSTWRPYPHTTTVCWAFGVWVAVALDLSDDVAALRDLLGPYRGQHIASGAGAVAYNGPVELPLGIAARHLGLHDDAVAELEAAARACAANGAAGFHVEARCELAQALVGRGGGGDAARALALAGDVATEAEGLDMEPWAARARRLAARLEGERGDPLSPREREVAGLVAQGLTNREIAARLVLSERTAQNHVQHILTKLGLPNRGQIAVWMTREQGRSLMSTSTE